MRLPPFNLWDGPQKLKSSVSLMHSKYTLCIPHWALFVLLLCHSLAPSRMLPYSYNVQSVQWLCFQSEKEDGPVLPQRGSTKPTAICMMDLYDVDFHSSSGFSPQSSQAVVDGVYRANEMKWNYLSAWAWLCCEWWSGCEKFGGISREKWDKRDKWWQSAFSRDAASVVSFKNRWQILPYRSRAALWCCTDDDGDDTGRGNGPRMGEDFIHNLTRRPWLHNSARRRPRRLLTNRKFFRNPSANRQMSGLTIN